MKTFAIVAKKNKLLQHLQNGRARGPAHRCGKARKSDLAFERNPTKRSRFSESKPPKSISNTGKKILEKKKTPRVGVVDRHPAPRPHSSQLFPSEPSRARLFSAIEPELSYCKNRFASHIRCVYVQLFVRNRT